MSAEVSVAFRTWQSFRSATAVTGAVEPAICASIFSPSVVGGYTSASQYSRVVLGSDLGRWMADRDIAVTALDESVVDKYVKQRRTQGELLAKLVADQQRTGLPPAYLPKDERAVVITDDIVAADEVTPAHEDGIRSWLQW